MCLIGLVIRKKLFILWFLRFFEQKYSKLICKLKFETSPNFIAINHMWNYRAVSQWNFDEKWQHWKPYNQITYNLYHWKALEKQYRGLPTLFFIQDFTSTHNCLRWSARQIITASQRTFRRTASTRKDNYARWNRVNTVSTTVRPAFRCFEWPLPSDLPYFLFACACWAMSIFQFFWTLSF